MCINFWKNSFAACNVTLTKMFFKWQMLLHGLSLVLNNGYLHDSNSVFF